MTPSTSRVETPTTDPGLLVMQLLSGGRARRWKDAVGWGMAIGAVALKGRAKWREWRTEQSFRVVVTEADDIYTDIQEWLLEKIPQEKRRSLLATTRRGSSGALDEVYAASPAERRQERRIWLSYEGSRDQRVTIGGHTIVVSVSKRELGQQDSRHWGEPARIAFSAETADGREAVVAFLQEVADAYEERRRGASLYVATRWGEWARANDMPPRPIDSVVLAGTQREDLIDDLSRFIADEGVYVRLGIPWHRGYLFHGPPGTGKTSIAKALAGHLGLDLYYMPLGDLASDTDLARLLSNLEPRSVLLLEDIDVAHAAKVRDDSGKGVSLSGLLQALDGVMTPHGLVTMMTTNDRDALDEALVRVGRADVTVEISHLVDEQLVRLVASLSDTAQPTFPAVTGQGITPAEVIELAKGHLHDGEAIVSAIYTGLLERVDA